MGTGHQRRDELRGRLPGGGRERHSEQRRGGRPEQLHRRHARHPGKSQERKVKVLYLTHRNDNSAVSGRRSFVVIRFLLPSSFAVADCTCCHLPISLCSYIAGLKATGVGSRCMMALLGR